MPENNYGLEIPPGYKILSVRIGMPSREFLEEIENLTYAWGELTRISYPIGYFALTPWKVMVGANDAISRIDRGYDNLRIRMGNRTDLVDLANAIPSLEVSRIFHRLGRSMTPFGGLYTINTVAPKMLEILQNY